MARFRRIYLSIACGLLIAASAQAQSAEAKLPSQARSVIYLYVKAEKGLECGLLKLWESRAIKVQALQSTQRWSQVDSQTVAEAIARDIEKTTCDNDAMTGWIEASRRGFVQEFLPPHLVVYQTLASMERPPKSFASTTLKLDYRAAIERIDAQFEALAASGAKGEGGTSWDDYRAGIAGIVTDSVAAAQSGTEPVSKKMREVQTMMTISAVIVDAWLDNP